jgi:hypothetical protein
MATVTGVHQVVFALREHGTDMERSIADEMAVLAQIAARTMQRLAPKSRSTLRNSIDVKKVDDTTYDIRPTVNYSEFVEFGVKPGGRGLPRFFDPASASIVSWLQSHPAGGGVRVERTAAKGSKTFQAAMLSLRDRYEGLALHVRKHGVKAQPFVAPTAREMEPIMLRRLDLAVRRVLASRPDAGSATA